MTDIQSNTSALQAELQSLHKAIYIINHLAAELDILTAMDNVRQVVLELLSCEKVTLFLVFDRRQELRGITRGPNNSEFLIRVKFGEGIAGTVAATGELMNIPDTYAHPLFNSSVDRTTGFRTHNMLCCAISDMTGKNVAVLQALNKHAGERFSETDERLLKLFGTHLGNTLAKAKLHESANRERNRLSALYAFFKAMTEADDLEELLLLAQSALRDVLQAQHSFVFLLDGPRKELWTTFNLPGTSDMGSARVHLGSGIVGHAAETGQVYVQTADAEGSPRPRSLSAAQASVILPHDILHDAAAAGPTGDTHSAAAASGRHTQSSSGLPAAAVHRGSHRDGTADTGGVHSAHEPPCALTPNLIDTQLMRQIAPVLGDSPVSSVLVQPLLAPDDKVMGVVLAVNKRETGSERDILFEDYFTEADVEAMALFALEFGSALSDRSLECALASAMSVVGHDGTARGTSSLPGALHRKEPSEESRDLMLRSQLISMYYQPGPDRRRGSEGSGALSPSVASGTSRASRYQRSVSKLKSPTLARLSISQGRLPGSAAPDSDGVLGTSWQRQTHDGHSANSRAHWPQPGLSPRTTLSSSYEPRDYPGSLTHPDTTSRLALRSQKSATTTQLPLSPVDQNRILAQELSLSQPSDGPNSSFGVTSAPGSGVMGAAGLEVFTPTAAGTTHTPFQSQMAQCRAASLTYGYGRFRPTPEEHPSLDHLDAQLADGQPLSPELSTDHMMSRGNSLATTRQASDLSAMAVLRCTSMPHSPTSGSSTPSVPHINPLLRTSHSVLHQHLVTLPLHRLSNMGVATTDDTGLRSQHHSFTNKRLLHLNTAGSTLKAYGPDGGQVCAHTSASAPPTARQEYPGDASGDSFGSVSTIQDTTPHADTPTSATPGTTSYDGTAGPAHPLGHAPLSSSWHHLPSLAGGGQSSFFDPQDILRWQFDLTHMDTGELVKLCYDLFQISGVMTHFNLSHKRLRAFLTAVASHHHAIPYHNFNHVCHVLHGVCLLLQTDMVRRSLPPEEHLALMIAAICHDLDHDGYSNAFHVNSQSELARIYNDVSVLENHHCAMTFAILRRRECALLDALEPETRKRLRKAIIAAILSTDMSHHFAVTQEFKRHPVVYDPESEADRMLLMKVLLHASDIGSAVRPLAINDVLSRRVHQEFAALAEKEVQAGLPVTLAVNPADPRMCAQVECNFLDYVVTPLWERLVEVVPELQDCWVQLQDNRKAYDAIRSSRLSHSGLDRLSDTGAAHHEGSQ